LAHQSIVKVPRNRVLVLFVVAIDVAVFAPVLGCKSALSHLFAVRSRFGFVASARIQAVVYQPKIDHLRR
jgi:hypothetical protein